MAENRGKKFENVVREAFEKVSNVSIDRLHDQTTGYLGSSNICDFIVYRKPYEYYFECKTIHGNTFPFVNVTDTQLKGMLEKSQIKGVKAGIICWWVDRDVTKFIPIKVIALMKMCGHKSIRYDFWDNIIDTDAMETYKIYSIHGKKKRVFFDYDMEELLNEISNTGNQ